MTGSVLGVWVSSANKTKKNQTLRTFILQSRLTITIITQKIIEFVQM